MSYNGSGTYIPPAGQPVATGTVIQSSTFNTLVTDIGNTLNNVLPRDGQASMSGQLKITDGTSGVPGIAFNSEASTGMFRPVSGALALVASGVENLRINSAGRVMIGTTTDDGTNKLQVNGPVKVSGVLTAAGVTNTGNGSISGTLGVTGNATVGGTLGVTGATSLSSVSTSGAATVGTTLGVSGNATVTGTLGVTGATSLSSVSTSGAATVGTTLGVTGAATLSSTLGVTGATSLSSVSTSGSATVGTTLGVTGNATVGGTLGVTGASNFTGSVGVGTATPGAKLDVESGSTSLNTLFGSSATTVEVAFSSSGNSATPRIGAQANDLYIKTNGTEAARVTSAGNVGIGVTSPAGKLHVNGRTQFGVLGVSGQYASTFNPDTSGQAVFHIKAASNAMVFGAGGDAYTNFGEFLRLDNNGNLGLGTASPAYKFHAQTDGASTQNWVASKNAAATALAGAGFIAIAGANGYYGTFKARGDSNVELMTGSGSGSLVLGTVGNENARLDTNGNLMVGKTSPNYYANNRHVIEVDGTTNGAVVACTTAGGQAAYMYGAGDNSGQFYGHAYMSLSTNGAERARIDNAGNMSIGTTSTPQKLSVNGGLAVAGAATLGASSSAGLMSLESSTMRNYVGDGTGWAWAFSTRSGSATSDLVKFKDNGDVLTNIGGGNLMVGASSPQGKLTVGGTISTLSPDVTSVGQFLIDNTGLASLTSYKGTGSALRFSTADTTGSVTERARYTASGNLLIGQTIENGGRLQVTSANGNVCTLNSSEVNGSFLMFQNSGTVNGYLGAGRALVNTALNDIALRCETGALVFASAAVTRMQITAAGVIQDAAGNELGYKDAPQNVISAAYTLTTADRGKSVIMNAASTAVTIPNGVFAGGAVITIYNNSGSAQSIIQGTGMTLKYGIGASPATGNRTLANNGICTIYIVNAGAASISGNGVS